MNKENKLMNFIFLNIVLFLMPLADIFYLIPSKITSGGLYGIAIVIMHLLNIENMGSIAVAMIVFVLSIPLLIYSYLYFSKEYFNKTFYATIMLPVYMILMGNLVAYLGITVTESNIFIATIMGSLIQAVGVGISMVLGGSTGGFDILAKIANKYFPKISIGFGIAIANLFTTLLTSIMFGMDRGLASIISIFLTGWIINLTLWMFERKKQI